MPSVFWASLAGLSGAPRDRVLRSQLVVLHCHGQRSALQPIGLVGPAETRRLMPDLEGHAAASDFLSWSIDRSGARSQALYHEGFPSPPGPSGHAGAGRGPRSRRFEAQIVFEGFRPFDHASLTMQRGKIPPVTVRTPLAILSCLNCERTGDTRNDARQLWPGRPWAAQFSLATSSAFADEVHRVYPVRRLGPSYPIHRSLRPHPSRRGAAVRTGTSFQCACVRRPRQQPPYYNVPPYPKSSRRTERVHTGRYGRQQTGRSLRTPKVHQDNAIWRRPPRGRRAMVRCRPSNHKTDVALFAGATLFWIVRCGLKALSILRRSASLSTCLRQPRMHQVEAVPAPRIAMATPRPRKSEPLTACRSKGASDRGIAPSRCPQARDRRTRAGQLMEEADMGRHLVEGRAGK